MDQVQNDHGSSPPPYASPPNLVRITVAITAHIFPSVAIVPPMDILGSKQQAFLLPRYIYPPHLVRIGVVGVTNDTDRSTNKAYCMLALGLAKLCRPTFIRLCWH